MATTRFDVRYTVHPEDYQGYGTERLRNEFHIPQLFFDETVYWVYSHYDRYMAGGAMPVQEEIPLESIDPLRSDNFLDRREIGIINVGGSGTVIVGGQRYDLAYKEALYLGKGASQVSFAS
ncbi:MAG: 5-dehydro-4-deoxy-D-glucuronate isomerase, partial [Bacteroidota bacterium]